MNENKNEPNQLIGMSRDTQNSQSIQGVTSVTPQTSLPPEKKGKGKIILVVLLMVVLAAIAITVTFM